jgi:hypothetical protein
MEEEHQPCHCPPACHASASYIPYDAIMARCRGDFGLSRMKVSCDTYAHEVAWRGKTSFRRLTCDKTGVVYCCAISTNRFCSEGKTMLDRRRCGDNPRLGPPVTPIAPRNRDIVPSQNQDLILSISRHGPARRTAAAKMVLNSQAFRFQICRLLSNHPSIAPSVVDQSHRQTHVAQVDERKLSTNDKTTT